RVRPLPGHEPACQRHRLGRCGRPRQRHAQRRQAEQRVGLQCLEQRAQHYRPEQRDEQGRVERGLGADLGL
ncbi:hypothetical protein LTR16_010231, partial [Cryomyces antarcticus]